MRNRSGRTAVAVFFVATAVVAVPVTAATVPVAIDEFFFDGKVVAIAAGDTVTWRNLGFMVHTSTSGEPGDPGAGSEWNSGLLNPGGQFSHTFNAPGVFDYYCDPHSNQMFGQVIVDGAGVHATMIPENTILSGQPLRMEVFLFNFEAVTANVNVQLKVTTPNGMTVTLIDRNLPLPAGARLEANLNLQVPPPLPPGGYIVTVELRDPAGNIVSSDADTYTKIFAADGRKAEARDIRVRDADGFLGLQQD